MIHTSWVSNRYQLSAFVVIIATIGLMFFWRIGYLLPLYTNTTLRDEVRTSVTAVADREGWILSDILAQSVTEEEVRFIHREHLRGEDSETCFILTLNDSSLHPCDEKQR